MKTKLAATRRLPSAICHLLFAICYLLSAICHSAFAQGTAFTYQGRLNDGANPAGGIYDLRFTIYDSTNNPGVVIAGPATNSASSVSNGLFSVALDFGTGVFTGTNRWLEIGVRTNGSGAFTTLTPRQKLTATPYAITAGNVTGVIPSSGLSGTYGGILNFPNSLNSFTGSGAGLSGLTANNLTTGTVPDARLSPNVALRNVSNTFTGNQAVVSGNLGVGTSAPSARLEVAGQVKITGGLPGAGKVLTSDDSGLARWDVVGGLQVVTVDASGNGDYTNINSALSAINPSGTNSVVVLVRPGTYSETIWLKSNVHLKGSGRESTVLLATLASPTTNVAAIRLNHVTNVMISGFTITPNSTGFLTRVGIYDEASSPTITDNTITGFAGLPDESDLFSACIYSVDSSPTITRNRLWDSGGPIATTGVGLLRCSAVVMENEFRHHAHALINERSSSQILANDFNECGVGVQNRADHNLLIYRGGFSANIAFNRFFGTNDIAIENAGEARIIGNDIGGKFNFGIDNRGAATIVGNTISNVFVNSIFERSGKPTTITANLISFNDSPNHALVIANSSPVVFGNYFLTNTGGDINVVGSGLPLIGGNYTRGEVLGTAIIGGFGAVNLQATNNNLVLNAPGLVEVRAHTSIQGDLDVSGTIIGAFDTLNAITGLFTSNITVSGSANVGSTLTTGGNTTVGGTLTVFGPTSLKSSLIAGTAQFTNTVSVINNTTVGGSLNVAGPSTFTSSVSAASFTGNGSNLTGIYSLDASDGTPSDAVFVNNTGRVGIGLTSPLHRLHVGTTLGTSAFNASTNVIAIEDANENGRATFLALAGIGSPDSTNRVEVQIEAVESTRRGIMGTTTEHPLYVRVGNSDVIVLATNRFVGINTSSPTERLHVIGNILATGTITPNSDRNAKTDLKPVDVAATLERVVTLPIQQWRFKTEPDQVKHVGPMAQDFRAAFGLGAHETAIATVDADGVALAAIQGLNQKVEVKIQKLEAENAELKRELDELKQLVGSLAGKSNGGAK